jgi:hypothetical protein
MTLKQYRTESEDGPDPASETPADYRTALRSRRWNAAPLKNPEVDKINPWIAVLAITVVSVITFVLLVLGYASGFWH